MTGALLQNATGFVAVFRAVGFPMQVVKNFTDVGGDSFSGAERFVIVRVVQQHTIDGCSGDTGDFYPHVFDLVADVERQLNLQMFVDVEAGAKVSQFGVESLAGSSLRGV